MKTNRWTTRFLLMLLPSIFLFQATAAAENLYTRAADSAAQRAAKSLETWAQKAVMAAEEKKLALWAIENDKDERLAARLEANILKTGHFRIYSRAETADFKNILKENNRQIKYEDGYDTSSLVMLGGLIAPRRILVGRMENTGSSGAGVSMTLMAKVLDLQTGEVVWADVLSVEEKAHLTALSWAWRIAVVLFGAAMAVMMVFMLNQQTLDRFFVWIVFSALPIGLFWFLIGRFL